MFKKQIRYAFLFLVFGLALLPFQNCGKSFELNEDLVSQSLSSLIEPAEQVEQEEINDHDTSVVEVTKVQTTYEPLLVDRHYIKNLFNEIFGPKTNSVVGSKIFDNPVDFGSACSMYGDLSSICDFDAPALLVAPVNPKGTVTRQALITKACSDLTTNTTTLNYALKKISSETIPSATDENIKNLFLLFYRDKEDMPQGLIDSLRLMLPATSPTKAQWQVVVYTMCISNYWQVL